MGLSVETIWVQVRSMTFEAEGFNSYHLRPESGGDLPQFFAGSKIDLHLPMGWPVATRWSPHKLTGIGT
jgi:hypothetical protein